MRRLAGSSTKTYKITACFCLSQKLRCCDYLQTALWYVRSWRTVWGTIAESDSTVSLTRKFNILLRALNDEDNSAADGCTWFGYYNINTANGLDEVSNGLDEVSRNTARWMATIILILAQRTLSAQYDGCGYPIYSINVCSAASILAHKIKSKAYSRSGSPSWRFLPYLDALFKLSVLCRNAHNNR